MIPHSTQNEVTSNTAAGNNFTLKASAEAFKILSSGIYEHKIRAIVRELSCNAYDSHVASGKKNEPFKVTLPTRISPTFSVQDFGIGLDNEDVLHLYSTYFESTKQQSNEYIGAKGLGSKSPLSYTDQFTVISVFEGVKSTYNAYVGSDGTPSISRLNAIESDEHNGLTVSMSVEPSDVYEFADEAKYVLKWFNTTPIVENASQEIVNAIPAEHPGYFGVSAGFGDSGKVFALMGNVIYDATSEYNRIIQDEADRELQRFMSFTFMGQCIVIEFALGELDTAASREHLSFDPETRKNFKQRVISMAENIKVDVQADIDSVDSVKDIPVLKYHSLISNNFVDFKGTPFDDYRVKFRHGKLVDGQTSIVDLDHSGYTKVVNPKRGLKAKQTQEFNDNFEPWSDDIVVLVKDAKKHLRHNLTEMRDERAAVQVLFTIDQDDLNRFKEDFAEFNIEVQYLSKRIEAGCVPEKKVRAGRGMGGFKVGFYSTDGERFDKLNLNDIKDDIDDLKKDGKSVFIWPLKFGVNYYGDLIDLVTRGVFGDDTVVLRVSEVNADKLVEQGYGVNYKKLTPTDEYAEMIAFANSNRCDALKDVHGRHTSKMVTMLMDEFFDDLEFTDNVTRKDIELFNKIDKSRHSFSTLKMLKKYNIDDKWNFEDWKFDLELLFFNELKTRFPMLNLVKNSWFAPDHLTEIREYVSMMIEREKAEEKEKVAA